VESVSDTGYFVLHIVRCLLLVTSILRASATYSTLLVNVGTGRYGSGRYLHTYLVEW
jgi:hypothetical protein